MLKELLITWVNVVASVDKSSLWILWKIIGQKTLRKILCQQHIDCISMTTTTNTNTNTIVNDKNWGRPNFFFGVGCVLCERRSVCLSMHVNSESHVKHYEALTSANNFRYSSALEKEIRRVQNLCSTAAGYSLHICT